LRSSHPPCFPKGVILSTAFVHLLQDAFERLHDPQVISYTDIGRWTGLIVLCSLLIIFLIEYISTAYVDNLQSYSSLPPTPKIKHVPFPPASSHPVSPTRQVADEATPLLDSRPSEPTARPPHRHTIIGIPPHNLVLGHHRHEPHGQHERHHSDHPRCGLAQFYGTGDREEDDAATNKMIQARDHHAADHRQSRHHLHSPHHSHGDIESSPGSSDTDAETDSTADEAELKIGRKRQIIGILVLQLGIMLHSLVIGFTLALASGADFESLVTAIVFHQLFEGLSLGIRIAALAPPASPEQSSLGWLRPVLALLFALTTPAGILSGLIVFGGDRNDAASAGAKVAEGVLCAISAGMLIYAACVEMLAADIVLDPTLWRSSKGRQIVALLSVMMGAAGMVLLEIVN